MIRRVIRDESGMTMGLTVILIVLIGVMGAGLLTFVQNDLGTVIESNQGQTAFNLADAGTQAAKRHLLLDANVSRYDGSTANGESPWSCVPDANNVCTAGSGMVIDLGTGAGTETRVWIKYLPPATDTTQLENPNHAPELAPVPPGNYEFGRDFFRVISEGRAGNARRKVEAIYQTYDLGTPRAYFTKGNIIFQGDSSIENISLFTMGNITGNAEVTGPDLAYGDWNNPPFNTMARSSAQICTTTLPDGTSVSGKCAGVGALGQIDSRILVPNRDFDIDTTIPFCKKEVPQDISQCISGTPPRTGITFPFNYQRDPDMNMMRDAAKLQGNYYEVAGGSASIHNSSELGIPAGVPKWGANSSISTVVFVKFMNNANMATNVLNWDVDASGSGCNRPPVFGTLVVENGTFDTGSNKAPLKGTIVIKGAGPGTEVYKGTGGPCMQVFIHATGDIKLAGNIEGFTEERGNRPGFFGVRQWSWRECYSASCTS